MRGGIYSPMDEMTVGAFSCAIVGRPLRVGRPKCSDEHSGDARLVASDAGTGRPAGFGRPTCRTSEGRRTSVRFGGLLTL